MKKLLISGVALLLTAATLSAQQPSLASINADNRKLDREEKRTEKRELKELEGPQVSTASKNNFPGDFGNISDVSWKRTIYFDEATFKQDNITETAYYDGGSDLVGTTSPKNFSDLPADAQKSITKKYKDYNITSVVFFDDNEYNPTDMLLYDTRFDDEDLYFAELQKDNQRIILTVNMAGTVSFFKRLS